MIRPDLLVFLSEGGDKREGWSYRPRDQIEGSEEED